MNGARNERREQRGLNSVLFARFLFPRLISGAVHFWRFPLLAPLISGAPRFYNSQSTFVRFRVTHVLIVHHSGPTL